MRPYKVSLRKRNHKNIPNNHNNQTITPLLFFFQFVEIPCSNVLMLSTHLNTSAVVPSIEETANNHAVCATVEMMNWNVEISKIMKTSIVMETQ